MKAWKIILCPIDFSASCERVLDVAAHVAAGEGARLTLLHVTDAHGALSDATQVTPEEGGGPVGLARYARDTALRELERCAAPLRAKGLTVDTAFAAGAPVAAILRAVGDLGADLVVMGTHGRTGLAHVVLGSVAERVLRGSPVPVLTVRQAKGDEAHHTAAEDALVAERDG
jgi:nucleotide-binding universal stress UspA family protein